MIATILVADDDPNIRELLHFYLTSEGYRVILAKDGEEALAKMETEQIVFAILDVMMPKKNGIEVCEIIRKDYNIPMIMLTALGELHDKTSGFIAGTDDYMVKPFEPEELVLRMRALLRRYHLVSEKKITMGNIVLDANAHEISCDGQRLNLPLKEFQLLFYLASNPNRTFTREQLIATVWGMDFEGDDRTVDVHIKRIREKFHEKTSDFQLKTIRGLGYKLEVRK